MECRLTTSLHFLFEHSVMPSILLSTLNARYFHSAFGLRYLLANMGDLQAETAIQEFIITQRPLDIAEAILAT